MRLVIPFVIGIISSIYLQHYPTYLFYLFILSIIGYGIALHKKIHISYQYSWIFGVLFSLFLFLSGYYLSFLHTEKMNPHHFNLLHSSYHEAILTIDGPIRLKAKSISTVAQLTQLKQDEKWENAEGKIQLYLALDSCSRQLKYGDVISISGYFQEISPAQNPEEFNYKQYLAFHAIYYQVYGKSEDWKQIKNNEGNPLFQYSYTAQHYLSSIFSHNGINGQELAVLSALLLGARENIDPELVHAYASTGALHVLSVSGLHVGLIYMVLNYLLSFLKKIKHGGKVKAFILLLFLWTYAFITGLPPSVVRAAAMFSFIIVGQSFNKQTNIYNTLAASALVQLLFNPYIIMEVGFQLSYLAVIGIVALQPRIYNAYYTSNWVLDKIWALTSVSLAAQLITFPLGLLYFHQFPNYFLLSNLFVIPLSTLIIYIALALFVLTPFQWIGCYFAKLLTFLLQLLNQSVTWIERIPYSLVEGISISIFQTWLIYGILISLLLVGGTKRRIALYSFFSCCLLLLSSEIVEKVEQLQQKKIIVYAIKNESAIDFINGRHHIFLSSDQLKKNKGKMLFHIEHNWWKLGLSPSLDSTSNTSATSILIQSNFMQLGHAKILLLKHDSLFKSIKSPIQLDYLILSNNCNVQLSDLKNNCSFKRLIFDSSNSTYRIKKWKKECEELRIDYYDVNSMGAFVVDV